MWGIIGTIIIGFFAGLIARAIHPGDDKLGFWLTAVLGIVGAVTATFLGKIISSTVKPRPSGRGYKVAIPKVLDCGKAQFNTFIVSLKRYESRVEIG